MKLLLYSDIHASNMYSFNVKQQNGILSDYSRIDELYSTLSWIATEASENNIDVAINLGDTFHQGLKFFIERYNNIFKYISEINKSTNTECGIIIEGNHDKSGESSAIETMLYSPNSIIIKDKIKIKYYQEIDSYFVFVPYIRDKNKIVEVFSNFLYNRFKTVKSNIYVFCHIEIKEVFGNLCLISTDIDNIPSYNDLKLHIYSGIFSGHIHSKVTINNNMHFIGSSLNHNFSDSGVKKDITILDITNTGCNISYKTNPYCPLFVTIKIWDEKDVDKNIYLITSTKNSFPKTNIYGRFIYKTQDELESFIERYRSLFTSFESKSEEKIDAAIGTANEIDTRTVDISLNAIDIIAELGKKNLRLAGKSEEEIEEYYSKLRELCQLD